MLRRSSPITAAGPSLILTGFPIKLKLRAPEVFNRKKQEIEAKVKRVSCSVPVWNLPKDLHLVDSIYIGLNQLLLAQLEV